MEYRTEVRHHVGREALTRFLNDQYPGWERAGFDRHITGHIKRDDGTVHFRSTQVPQESAEAFAAFKDGQPYAPVLLPALIHDLAERGVIPHGTWIVRVIGL